MDRSECPSANIASISDDENNFHPGTLRDKQFVVVYLFYKNLSMIRFFIPASSLRVFGSFSRLCLLIIEIRIIINVKRERGEGNAAIAIIVIIKIVAIVKYNNRDR